MENLFFNINNRRFVVKRIVLLLFTIFNILNLYSNNFNSGNLKIEIPGHFIANGQFTPRKIIDIPRLDPKYYLQNVIHIKTKSNLPLIKNKYAELTPSIQSSANNLGSIKVRALFPEYSDYKIMSQDRYGVGRIYELQYSNPLDPYDVCKQLMKNPEIEYACPIFIRYTNFTPNDPLTVNQYYLTNIFAYQAWDVSLGDSTVTIAIIDSGIDYTHPDLSDNIADGKYDFVGDVTYTDVQTGNWKEDEDPKPSSNSNTHGTHVTGCANAVTNNGIGIASISANCKYIPIKVGADNPNVGGIYRGYEAILYAARKGAKVINCSWGGPGYSPAEQDIINQAVALGSVVVVAAGNDGLNLNSYPQYPANYENVICVGATTQAEKVASFSNYGHSVTVFAPGQTIFSTIPGNRYTNYDGTSMASPIVAGLAGLVRSVFPQYTPKQVYHQIRSTVDNFVSNIADRPLYFGRINAYKAVTFNNPKFPDRKISGCEVSEFTISGSDAISNYARQTLNLKIKNYLSPTTQNFKVRISSYDKNLKIYGNQFLIGKINSLEEAELKIDVELLNTNLWFSGYVDVLITFEDDNYLDYDLLKIPIKIKSENTYASQYFIPSSYDFKINHSHSSDFSSFWAVGSVYNFLSVAYVQNQNSSRLIPLGNNRPQAVYVFSSTKAAIAQNSLTSVPSVAIVNNQGQTLLSRNLTNYFAIIKNVLFFDDNNGVAIGDPFNNRIGVALTTDGGNSWIAASNTLPTSTNEKVITGAITSYNDYVWFGTTVGKVYRSSDKGKNWAVYYVNNAGSIPHLAFKDVNNGLAIYIKNDGSYNIARTTNSGINWVTDIFDLSNFEYKPVYLYAPKNKNAYIIVMENGAVFISHNDGQTWKPILSRFTENVASCAAVLSGNNVRIWMASSTNISTLDFPIPVPNPVKNITITSGDNFNFGNVVIGQSKIERIQLKNNGNTRTFIDKVYIKGENADEFSTTIGTSEYIDAGGSGTVRIRFSPKDKGERKAILVIESDAEPYRIEFPIFGYGVEPVNASFTVDVGNALTFDTVEVGNQKERLLKITNNGQTILDLEISVDNTNFLFNATKQTFNLDTGESLDITIIFKPQIEGELKGNLKIKDKNSGITKDITLRGYGINYSSYRNKIEITGIYPNPVIENAICYIQSKYLENITAKIVNLNGKTIEIIYEGKLYEGENLLVIPVEKLSPGSYFLILESDYNSKIYKFIKN